MEQQPTLYVLVRTDMDSMNAGKGMAQACHAANAFTHNAEDGLLGLTQWLGYPHSTPRGFGTTIVLAIDSEKELHEVLTAAQEDGFSADFVVDHTYPVKDGKITHLLPVVTCGYAFTRCRKTHPISSLAGLELHK